jgi:hypothetical protein
MKNKTLIFLMGILIVGTFLSIPSTVYSLYTGVEDATDVQPEFALGRLILKLKPEVDRKIILGQAQGVVTTGIAALDNLNFKFKVQKAERLFKEFKETALKLDRFSSIYVLEVSKGTDLKKMKAEYENLSEVEYVELDYKLELFEEPNDPLLSDQWYLNNTGQGYLGINRISGDYNDTQIIKYGTEDADIDALEAFERGDEITIPLVGIIDTGVDCDHQDLADNMWTNPGEVPDNDVDDDHNGFVDDFYGWDFSGNETDTVIEDSDPTDYYGHGTHCAGIVASVRNNGMGVSGITSPCRIMAIKFFPNSFFSLGAKSIIYAADMGCDVINMSWGSAFPSQVISDALDYAVDKGVLPIAAAGNSGGRHCYWPACLSQVFTVGASNSDDEVTYFSTYGEHLKVVAPGEDILSLRADLTDMYAEGGASGIEPNVHIVDQHYYLADGTSMASPCAVGVAAYILAASPGISNDRVKEIIQESADDILYPYGGDTLYSPGVDMYSGHGRVNLNSALQLLNGRLAKIDYPYKNAIVSGDVAILGTASGDSFQNYVLEYGQGYSPATWTEIENSNIPVSKDTLGNWNSSGLSGRFAIRLTVGDENQEVVHVIANNFSHVNITSPSQGDTIKGYAEIWGNTIVSDFSHYTLEYGYGASPSLWDTIIISTKMMADDLLGEWLVSFMEDGNYTIRLSVETNLGEIYGDSMVVMVKSVATDYWIRDLSSFGSLSPGVGDIDGDGWDEIVLGVGNRAGSQGVGGVEVFTHEGEREAGWPKDTDLNMMSSPAVGDLDGDGTDDIVICSEHQGVHAYLSAYPDWVKSANTGYNNQNSLASPMIADLENDGDPEVLMINDRGTVYAWRGNGQPVEPGPSGIFGSSAPSWDLGSPGLAVCDLDNDGENEVIAAAANYPNLGGLYIWDIEANRLLQPEDYPETLSYAFGMAIADIDESEDLEIIVFGADSLQFKLYVFKKDGSQVEGFPITLEDVWCGWWVGNHPAVGDLEGDGILEIVVTVWTVGQARIYAWHQDGTPVGSIGSGGLLVSLQSPDAEMKKELIYSLGNNIAEVLTKIRGMTQEEQNALFSTLWEPDFVRVAGTFGDPILADVNSDGYTDIVARAGCLLTSCYERIFAWDYEGNPIPGFPLYASPEGTFSPNTPFTPTVADMDKDGELNLVMASHGQWPNCKLSFWELDTDYNTIYGNWYRYWPEYMHDKWNSGVYGIQSIPEYNVTYVVYLINYLFKSGPPPYPMEFADVNCDGAVDVQDVVYLINYLFKGGPPPCE